MAKGKLPTTAEPRTNSGSPMVGSLHPSIGPHFMPDVVRLDPLLASDPPVGHYRVRTGMNILTHELTYRDVPCPPPKPIFDTPDRRPYKVVTKFQGSYNMRPFDHKPGDTVWLNEKELRTYSTFVEVPSG